MSLSPYTVVVFSQDTGNVVPFASVEIKVRNPDGSSGSYAPIYTNSTGATPITQPGATTNSRGTFQFYASADGYNVEYTVDGQTIVQPVDVGVTDDQLDTEIATVNQSITNLLNLINSGGIPKALTLPDSQIGIVAGTVRQDGNNAVTITSSGTTATVSHVNHGYATGDLLYIRKANQDEYNVSSVAITVIDANTYTYPFAGSATSPATTSEVAITASVPKYWDYILDAAHTPVGCDTTGRIEASGSQLPIPFSTTYTKVISLIAGPDETLANGLNMACGASVGLSSINIKSSIDITLAAHVWYDGTNWQWTYGTGQGGTAPQNIEIEEVTFPTNGNVEVKHSLCPGIDVQVSGFTNLGAVAPYIPLIRASNDSTVFLNFQDTGGTLRSDSTPNTSHSFHLTKNYSEGIRMDGQGSFDFDLYEGNIWFLGIFEV